jgi:hypothetical protein
MSLNNRNFGHDSQPPRKNSRSASNNSATHPASSLRVTNLLPASQPPSAYYNSFVGNYGGDSSGIQRILLAPNQFGTSGSLPRFGMANGDYSTASFGASHPFVGLQKTPSANAPSVFISTASEATASLYKGQPTASTTNHKMPSVNEECSYARGDGCLVLSMPHRIQLETCGLCKQKNLHHLCEAEASHKQVLLRLGVECYEGLHTCFNCLPDRYPELSEKGEGNGTEQGLGGVEGNDLEQGLGGGGANDLEQDLVEEGESANMPPLDEPSPYIALLQDDDLEQDEEDDDFTFGELYQHSARRSVGRWIEDSKNRTSCPLLILSAMAVGLPEEDAQLSRIKEFEASRWVAKRDIKVSHACFSSSLIFNPNPYVWLAHKAYSCC